MRRRGCPPRARAGRAPRAGGRARSSTRSPATPRHPRSGSASRPRRALGAWRLAARIPLVAEVAAELPVEVDELLGVRLSLREIAGAHFDLGEMEHAPRGRADAFEFYRQLEQLQDRRRARVSWPCRGGQARAGASGSDTAPWPVRLSTQARCRPRTAPRRALARVEAGDAEFAGGGREHAVRRTVGGRLDGELGMAERDAIVAPEPRMRASTAWAAAPTSAAPSASASARSWYATDSDPSSCPSARRASRAGRRRAPGPGPPAATRQARPGAETRAPALPRRLVQIGGPQQTSRPGGVSLSGVSAAARSASAAAISGAPRRRAGGASRALPRRLHSARLCHDRDGVRARPDPRARPRASVNEAALLAACACRAASTRAVDG